MKNQRYYSHYTFIYPDILLKNHIVELDNDGFMVNVFPFEKEVERTEFYSGLLAFIPKDADIQEDFLAIIERADIKNENLNVYPDEKFYFLHFENFSRK